MWFWSLIEFWEAKLCLWYQISVWIWIWHSCHQLVLWDSSYCMASFTTEALQRLWTAIWSLRGAAVDGCFAKFWQCLLAVCSVRNIGMASWKVHRLVTVQAEIWSPGERGPSGTVDYALTCVSRLRVISYVKSLRSVWTPVKKNFFFSVEPVC